MNNNNTNHTSQEQSNAGADSKQGSSKSKNAFRMGAHVMAYDERAKEWKAGQVVGINNLGRYDVSFENGREAVNLKAIQLMARDVMDSLRSTESNDTSMSRSNAAALELLPMHSK